MEEELCWLAGDLLGEEQMMVLAAVEEEWWRVRACGSTVSLLARLAT